MHRQTSLTDCGLFREHNMLYSRCIVWVQYVSDLICAGLGLGAVNSVDGMSGGRVLGAWLTGPWHPSVLQFVIRAMYCLGYVLSGSYWRVKITVLCIFDPDSS
jgi:hypothetical protein